MFAAFPALGLIPPPVRISIIGFPVPVGPWPGILNTADPFTGEVLSDDSIWKHPKIISDIKKYLEKHSDK